MPVLSFGGLTLALHTQTDLFIDAEFTPFLTPDTPADIQVDFREDPLISDICSEISPDGTQVLVRYGPNMAGRFGALRGCLIELPMEELLLKHHRFFLHASVSTSPWGGILFSGDSGVGKSTQADLWQKYRGSRLINGDRAILSRETPWRVYGSPYVGSSGCYVRDSVPVRAIVFLRQGKENLITPLSPGEAFRQLLLQSVTQQQEPQLVSGLCDLLQELAETVPLYQMICTPNKAAVDALAELLQEGATL